MVTDEKGEYRILELRPGTYSVTFTSPGFSTFKRDGIQLSPSFTATVTAELQVGELAETVTVSGAGPLINTQTMTQQKTIQKEILDAVPTAKSMLGIAALMPAVVLQPPNAQDVGGSKGERSVRLSVHGGKTTDARLLQDGMRYNALTPGIGAPLVNSNLEGTGRGYYVNPLASQEIVIDIGTMGSAQYRLQAARRSTPSRGWRQQLQRLRLRRLDRPSTASRQPLGRSRRPGADLGQHRAQGLQLNLALGGPIVAREGLVPRRRAPVGHAEPGGKPLWRREPGVAHAWSTGGGVALQPGPVQSGPALRTRQGGGRSRSHGDVEERFAFSYDWQKNFQDQLTGQLETGTIKTEANSGYCQQQDLTQATWTRPSSSRFLFDVLA